jgi:predicted nucleic acid-binding protein
VIFLLDTNVIADLMTNQTGKTRRAAEHLSRGGVLGLCQPVHYEILRGLLWRGATSKLAVYLNRIVPIMSLFEIDAADWEQAAHFWADTRRAGKQLGDPDLHLAALSVRVDAVVISSDTDFDALPIRRIDWLI